MVRASGEPDPHVSTVPSVADRVSVARELGHASARVITMAAAWVGLRRALEHAGLTAAERLEAVEWLARSHQKRGFRPHGAAFWLFARDLEPGDAEATARRLLADPPYGELELAAACFAAAPDAVLPDGLDRADLYRMPVAVGRAVLGRLTETRRQRVLDAIEVETGLGATGLLAWGCHLLDLMPAGFLPTVAELARDYSGSGPALASLEAGGPTVGPDGVSELVRPALDLSVQAKGAAAFKAGLAGVAEHATELRVYVAGIPELASSEAWDGASTGRRQVAAQQVASTLGSHFGADGEQVVHKKKKVRLVLRPGTRAAQDPYLIAERGIPMAQSRLKAWVFRGPFRLPTESEWIAARAGGEGTPEVCADAWREAPAPLGDLHRGPGPRVVHLGAHRVSAETFEGELVARPVIGLRLSHHDP